MNVASQDATNVASTREEQVKAIRNEAVREALRIIRVHHDPAFAARRLTASCLRQARMAGVS